MKARPRSVENRVADALNEHFANLNRVIPVERIPVLGRKGPDISINEIGLVIDVKSRVEVPKALFFPLEIPFAFDPLAQLIGARLRNLSTLWQDECFPAPLDFSSKIVREYILHMDEWTRNSSIGNLVSCVILHRPEMPIGSSVAVIYSKSRRRLIENAKQYCRSNAVDHPRQ